MVGETALEMHRRLRLERAASRLSTDTSVTEIAFEAGYETHEAFTRTFRRAYALSPSEFRARRTSRTALTTKSGVHYRIGSLTFMGDKTMEATIETMSEMTVAALRHLGPYNRINETFARLGPLAAPLMGVAGVKMIAIYHDDPESTPAAELRSDAGLVVPTGTPIPAGLTSQTIAGGRYVKTIHRGPYETLGDTWANLMGGWIPKHDLRIARGTSYEIYRNDPSNAKPEDLITEIYVPLG
jgi:AraC family transcriptional regulator